ncbi:MAG: hypothetical protein ACM3UT_05635 [Chloroflexota bacterium]
MKMYFILKSILFNSVLTSTGSVSDLRKAHFDRLSELGKLSERYRSLSLSK